MSPLSLTTGVQHLSISAAASRIEMEAEAALARMQEHRTLKLRKCTKKPTVTILSRETSAITKQRHHATYLGHSDGSLSFTHQFVHSVQCPLVPPATEQPGKDIAPPVWHEVEDPLVPDIDLNTSDSHGLGAHKRTAGVSICLI